MTLPNGAFSARTTCSAIALAAAATLALPAAAQDRQRRADLAPYIEVGQVLTGDLSGDDVLTYTRVSAGVDASVQTRRVQVAVSYNYEHRFAYEDDLADSSVHTGVARAAAMVLPGFSVEGGAVATRARADVRGDVPGSLIGNTSNVSQIYSGYAGPTLATRVGPANVNAGYRFGYTRVEAPGVTGAPTGQPPIDFYDDSTSHLATASVGVRAGAVLPVGLTASGAWEREEAGQLDQRYEGRYARGDAVLPVGRGLAVVGGVGYEEIEISQRDPLRDSSGNPVTDGNGRQVTDPASPRRIAYDIDGIFWDAGVIWRPSTRTSLEARVGKRYGSWSYTGSLSYQLGRASAIQVGVYDSVQSFGRQLRNGLASLPTDFRPISDPFNGGYNGCVFGASGSAAGGCLPGVFQSIATANYRARGVDAVFAINRGPLRMGLGAGYSNREFIAPDGGAGFSVNGLSDDTFYAQFFAGQQVGASGQLSGNLFVNYYDSGLPGSEGLFGWGANTAYSHSFGRLGATAALGIYGVGQAAEADNSVAVQALLGLRYGF